MEAGDLIAGIKGLGSAENLTEGEVEGAGEVGRSCRKAVIWLPGERRGGGL